MFTATGVESDKPLVAARVSEWEFDIDDPDRVGQLRSLVDVSVPNPTVRAVMAIEALCDG